MLPSPLPEWKIQFDSISSETLRDQSNQWITKTVVLSNSKWVSPDTAGDGALLSLLWSVFFVPCPNLSCLNSLLCSAWRRGLTGALAVDSHGVGFDLASDFTPWYHHSNTKQVYHMWLCRIWFNYSKFPTVTVLEFRHLPCDMSDCGKVRLVLLPNMRLLLLLWKLPNPGGCIGQRMKQTSETWLFRHAWGGAAVSAKHTYKLESMSLLV